MEKRMPYWSIYCVFCSGYIVDALLECVPAQKRAEPTFRLLFKAEPGAALACPYCGGLFGFDVNGQPQAALTGWTVYRYGLAELELKKIADGEPSNTPLVDWAVKHRFTQPGTCQPFTDYTYAEQAPANEVVP
jgi:hypothetical protein